MVTMVDEGNGLQDNVKTFPYELLKVPLDVTVTGIGMTKREVLSNIHSNIHNLDLI